MAKLLETHSLSKSFGGLAAVSDVTLSVDQGDIHCIIGPNGAGKSTFFKLVVGTYQATSGRVEFDGADVTREMPFSRVKRGMSIKMQKPSVFKELPVRQNIHIALQHHVAYGELKSEEDRLLELLDLSASHSKLAGELSHGQQQWLEIGMAMALRPRLLLLDEPTAGMSPEETHKTGELILQLNKEGTTMLVVEHDMAFVRQIAKAVTVLHFGRKFAHGSINDIIADERVAEIYLGRTNHEH
ncbi:MULTISPECIES: ABC transporter ATP-binding protein [unclassified Rhizobium]|uniref:ABC transporter ATP-binding protein n=1 Tax=unclassified Rhizobium TaxID=2613769 RepID=UPI001ADA6062|nr:MULTISPECIES: ABC transporter ATP-binding protein [unclassified Rhizobium]MBO9123750.1 ABC transporter ATP-binding protein [Rhizobium sp. 16-488-2b]MBO9174282.1 ABC transporter ATP-binding protein [Rhizobium sp. 16-488-2a]